MLPRRKKQNNNITFTYILENEMSSGPNEEFINKITTVQNDTQQIVIPYKFTKHSLIKTDNQTFIKEFKIQSKHEFDKLLGTVIYIKNEHIVKH